MVGALQALVLLALGAWILGALIRRPDLPRARACAIVACYSAIFLYHRLYDMSILAIPLVYAAGRALSAQGRDRWIYRATALGLVWVLHLRTNHLEKVIPYARQAGFLPRVVEALILPHATWIVLLAVMALLWVERPARGQGSGEGADSPKTASPGVGSERPHS